MTSSNDSSDLRNAWLTAAADPTIALELESIYQLIADQVEARSPVCWASGRCCNFEKTGHRLYVTGLEAAYTVLHAPPLAPHAIAEARTRGDCPFLSKNLCTVHTIKPIACRTYFCDKSATEWQQNLTERSLDLVRKLHDKHAIPYRYAEWRDLLERLTKP